MEETNVELEKKLESAPEALKEVVAAEEGEQKLDNVESITKPKKPNKVEIKRQQIFIDRMKRWLSKNPSKSQMDAIQALQEEDWRNVPLDQKVTRLERILSQSLQGIGGDMKAINDNQILFSAHFDIMMRATKKCFEKLGLPAEEQAKIIQEAADEAKAEAAAHQATQERLQREELEKKTKAAKDATEHQAAALALKEAEKSSLKAKEAPTEAKPSIPDGATVFGG